MEDSRAGLAQLLIQNQSVSFLGYYINTGADTELSKGEGIFM